MNKYAPEIATRRMDIEREVKRKIRTPFAHANLHRYALRAAVCAIAMGGARLAHKPV